MSEYIAIFGNGTRRIFEAVSYGEACTLATGYTLRNRCGMVCNVRQFYRK